MPHFLVPPKMPHGCRYVGQLMGLVPASSVSSLGCQFERYSGIGVSLTVSIIPPEASTVFLASAQPTFASH